MDLGVFNTPIRTFTLILHYFTDYTNDVVIRLFYLYAKIYDKIVAENTSYIFKINFFFQFVNCSYRGYSLCSDIFRTRKQRSRMNMTISTKPGDKSEKQHAENTDSISDEPNLKGDWFNFCLLILLYTMQGVPLGFTQVIPIILQSNKEYASYKDQVSRGTNTSSHRAVTYLWPCG